MKIIPMSQSSRGAVGIGFVNRDGLSFTRYPGEAHTQAKVIFARGSPKGYLSSRDIPDFLKL
jgi:hypothetical protein